MASRQSSRALAVELRKVLDHSVVEVEAAVIGQHENRRSHERRRAR